LIVITVIVITEFGCKLDGKSFDTEIDGFLMKNSFEAIEQLVFRQEREKMVLATFCFQWKPLRQIHSLLAKTSGRSISILYHSKSYLKAGPFYR
jgi:hypothetical protein